MYCIELQAKVKSYFGLINILLGLIDNFNLL